MDMPNFDDGFDMFAPPTPEGSPEHPAKLFSNDRDMLWVFPTAFMVTAVVVCLCLWGLYALLK